jgi:hypothetical protein
MKSIGWKEKIDFPELGLKKVAAKVDTGARTSVLHCSSIQLIRKNRKSFVKFVPLDETFRTFKGKEFIFPFHKERTIKNSFGQEENRYVINTVVRMFRKEYPIEISLRSRSNMEFPVLLGRSFVRHTFLVDVAKSNLSARYHRKKKISADNEASPKA